MVGLLRGLSTGLPEIDLGAGLLAHGWYSILQSAGLLFFAFAGYARIATLGEEVREPARTIPRAIGIAFGIVVVIYALVAVTVLGALGSDAVAAEPAALSAAVAAAGWGWAEPVLRAGAAAASLGALLALIAGIGRTSLAMAREGDLPRPLAAVHPVSHVPHRAELLVGAAVVALVLLVDLRGAIGFSSFGVLLYYFVANAAAFTQPRRQRRVPRAVPALGALGCLVLVATLPWQAVLTGLGVLAAGALWRVLSRRVRAGGEHKLDANAEEGREV